MWMIFVLLPIICHGIKNDIPTGSWQAWTECNDPSPCRACNEVSRIYKMCMARDSICSRNGMTRNQTSTNMKNGSLINPLLTFSCDKNKGNWNMLQRINVSLTKLQNINVSVDIELLSSIMRQAAVMTDENKQSFLNATFHRLKMFFQNLDSCKSQPGNKPHCMMLSELIKLFSGELNYTCNELPPQFHCQPGQKYCFTLKHCIGMNQSCQFNFERFKDNDEQQVKNGCLELSSFCGSFYANITIFHKLCPELKLPSKKKNTDCFKPINNEVCHKFANMRDACFLSKHVCSLNSPADIIPQLSCCEKSDEVNPLMFTCGQNMLNISGDTFNIPSKYKCPGGQTFCFATSGCLMDNAECSLNKLSDIEAQNKSYLWKMACNVLPDFCKTRYNIYKEDLMHLCSAKPIIMGNLTVLLRHGKTIMENILLELFNLKMLEKGVLIKEIKRFRRNTMRMSCDVISDDDKDYVYVRPNCVLRPVTNELCHHYIWDGLVTLANGKIYEVKFIQFNSQFPSPSQQEMYTLEVPEWVRSTRKYAVKFVEIKHLNFTSAPATDKCFTVPDQLLKLVKDQLLYVACQRPVLAISRCKAPSRSTFMIKSKYGWIRKIRCSHIKRPIPISADSAVAYRPPYNSEQHGNLSFSFICKHPTTQSRRTNSIFTTKIDNKNHISLSYTNLMFSVTPTNSPPVTFDKIVFGPPVSYNVSVNEGFRVSAIMDVQSRLYGPGYFHGVITTTRFQPFIRDPDGPIENGGILVLDAKHNKEVGMFQFKCKTHTDWQTMEELRKNKRLLLTKYCFLRFNLTDDVNKKNNYHTAYLEILAWDGSNAMTSGFHDDIDVKSDAYSVKKAKLYVMQFGCDGIAGSRKKINNCKECSLRSCAKKCDGEFYSNARRDSCGICYGGSTGVIKNSRRYRMKFGWLGCCMQELECRQCPDHGPVKKDCNNHCWTRRPAYKKCGVCIGGNTGFDEKHVLNSCGRCKNNNSESCNAGYISSVQPKTMSVSSSVKQFQICLSMMYNNLTCQLQSTSAVCKLERYDKNKIERPHRQCYSVLFQRYRRKCILRYLYNSCNPGLYNLTCSYSGGIVRYTEPIRVKNGSHIVISLLSSTTLYPGRRSWLTMQGVFSSAGKYFCQFNTAGGKRMAIARHNETHLRCYFYPRQVETGIMLVVKDCNNQMSNAISVNVICDEPTITKKRFIWRDNSIRIHFDAAVKIYKSTGCENMAVLRRNVIRVRLNEQQANEGSYCLKNKCYGCPGVSFQDKEGCIDIKLPELTCSVNGPDFINTCGRLRLSPVMRNLKHTNWTVTTDDTNTSSSSVKRFNEELAANANGGFKFGSHLLPKDGGMYKFQMCGTSKYNRRCCAYKNVTIASATKLQCGIGGMYQSKRFIVIKPRIKSCNSLRSMLYEWIVKGDGRDIHQISNERVLRIAKRSALLKYDNITVQLRGTMQLRDNMTCMSAIKTIKLNKSFKLELAGGRKTVYATCEDQKVRIFSKVIPQTLEGDEIVWTCNPILDGVTSSQSCIDNSTGTDLVIDYKRKITLNAKEQLICGGEYNFSLAYTRGDITLYKSVKLIVADFRCPVVYCRVRENQKMFSISCVVKQAAKQNVTFTNFEDGEDYGVVDFNEVKKSVYINQLRPKRVGNDLVNMVRITAIIRKEFLAPNTTYRFDIAAWNEDCVADIKSIELIHHLASANCNVSIEPTEGIAFNTTFNVFIDGCDDEANLEFQAGPKINGRIRAQPFDSSNVIALNQLPRGDPDKGNMLEVVARVRNLNGKVSSFSTMVVVLPPLDDDEEILKESNKDIQNKIEEGDFISAASQIAQVNSGVVKQQMEKNAKQIKNSENYTDCETLSTEAQMQQDETAEMVKAMHNQPDVQSEETENAVASLTEKVCPQDVNSKVIKQMTNMALEKITRAQTKKKSGPSPSSRRKRRAIEEDKEAEEQQPMETSSIDLLVTSYSNNLFPILYNEEEEDEIGRKRFVEALPYLKQSLSSNLDGLQNLTITSNNIVLYTEMINTIVPNMNIHMPMKERIMFTDTMKSNFYPWQCTEDGEYCNGFTIAASTITGDIFSESPTSKLLVSNVFGLYLINPHPDESASFIDVPMVNKSLRITIPLTARNLTGDVKCHWWNSSAWSSEGCSTIQVSELEAVCKCSSLGHIAVFDSTNDEFYKFLETLEKSENIGTTSTMEPSTAFSPSPIPGYASSTVSKDASSKSTMESTNSEMTESGKSTATTTMAMKTTMTTTTITLSKRCQYSFDANFSLVITKYGGLEDARNTICSKTRELLQLSVTEFTDCHIKNGSIIVVFMLTQDSASINDTLQLLAKLVYNNEIGVTTPDGERLNTAATSFRVEGKKYEGVVAKKTESKHNDESVMAIVIVVVAILTCGIFTLAVAFAYKKKKQRKVEPIVSGRSEHTDLAVYAKGGEDIKKEPIDEGIVNPTYETNETF